MRLQIHSGPSAQLSLSGNTTRILRELADLGILGKTKAEIANRIVTDWIWANEDRLLRQGIGLREKRKKETSEKLRR